MDQFEETVELLQDEKEERLAREAELLMDAMYAGIVQPWAFTDDLGGIPF